MPGQCFAACLRDDRHVRVSAAPSAAKAGTQDVPLGRRPDFLKLWDGQSVSLFGSQATVLALRLTAHQALDERTPRAAHLAVAYCG